MNRRRGRDSRRFAKTSWGCNHALCLHFELRSRKAIARDYARRSKAREREASDGAHRRERGAFCFRRPSETSTSRRGEREFQIAANNLPLRLGVFKALGPTILRRDGFKRLHRDPSDVNSTEIIIIPGAGPRFPFHLSGKRALSLSSSRRTTAVLLSLAGLRQRRGRPSVVAALSLEDIQRRQGGRRERQRKRM